MADLLFEAIPGSGFVPLFPKRRCDKGQKNPVPCAPIKVAPD
jgi:hypothetical protein